MCYKFKMPPEHKGQVVTRWRWNEHTELHLSMQECTSLTNKSSSDTAPAVSKLSSSRTCTCSYLTTSVVFALHRNHSNAHEEHHTSKTSRWSPGCIPQTPLHVSCVEVVSHHQPTFGHPLKPARLRKTKLAPLVTTYHKPLHQPQQKYSCRGGPSSNNRQSTVQCIQIRLHLPAHHVYNRFSLEDHP